MEDLKKIFDVLTELLNNPNLTIEDEINSEVEIEDECEEIFE
ncbi:MAG: hypothetical protein ACI3VR_01025 [Intestinibacter sp.]